MIREPGTDVQGDDPWDGTTHPDTLNLSAAAAALIGEVPYEGQGSAMEGALGVWMILTGITDPNDAMDYAEQIATANIHATIPPF